MGIKNAKTARPLLPGASEWGFLGWDTVVAYTIKYPILSVKRSVNPRSLRAPEIRQLKECSYLPNVKCKESDQLQRTIVKIFELLDSKGLALSAQQETDPRVTSGYNVAKISLTFFSIQNRVRKWQVATTPKSEHSNKSSLFTHEPSRLRDNSKATE